MNLRVLNNRFVYDSDPVREGCKPQLKIARIEAKAPTSGPPSKWGIRVILKGQWHEADVESLSEERVSYRALFQGACDATIKCRLRVALSCGSIEIEKTRTECVSEVPPEIALHLEELMRAKDEAEEIVRGMARSAFEQRLSEIRPRCSRVRFLYHNKIWGNDWRETVASMLCLNAMDLMIHGITDADFRRARDLIWKRFSELRAARKDQWEMENCLGYHDKLPR